MIFSLLLTVIVGLFFLIGGLISLKVKNKNKLNTFSCALALVVILGLIFGDLIPEISANLSNKWHILIFIVLGFLMFCVLDKFIPNHHHEHHEKNDNKKEHLNHNEHIGKLTIISLIFHNVLEGLAITGLSVKDFKTGLLITLGVALHNVPLGTHIFSSIDLGKNKILIFLLAISSLTGGLIYLILGSINTLVIGVITAITLGMLFYIAIKELLPEVITHYKEKEGYYGLLLGMILIIISKLL